MASVAEKVESELESLVSEGKNLLQKIHEKPSLNFATEYQRWYTRSLVAVRQLLPDRLHDFTSQYRDEKRKQIHTESYVLEDYVRGTIPWGVDIYPAAASRFLTQLTILASATSRLSDLLANIRGLLQADLFDSELDAARHLLKNGHLRAGGAVAGVVLEGHLKELVQKHQIKLNLPRNKKPTIADYNDALKNAEVFSIPTWRGIQRLADIRNLCDHKSDTEPTADEVDELIKGTDKATKTLA